VGARASGPVGTCQFGCQDRDHGNQQAAAGQCTQGRVLAAGARRICRQRSRNNRVGATMIAPESLVSRTQIGHCATVTTDSVSLPGQPARAAAQRGGPAGASALATKAPLTRRVTWRPTPNYLARSS
jgi:hypothetical protein